MGNNRYFFEHKIETFPKHDKIRNKYYSEVKKLLDNLYDNVNGLSVKCIENPHGWVTFTFQLELFKSFTNALENHTNKEYGLPTVTMTHYEFKRLNESYWEIIISDDYYGDFASRNENLNDCFYYFLMKVIEFDKKKIKRIKKNNKILSRVLNSKLHFPSHEYQVVEISGNR